MDSLIVRSKTVRRKISDENKLAGQVKQLLPLLPEIDENKNLPIKMATKDDITEMVKYHRTKKVFDHNILEEKPRRMRNNSCLLSITIVNLIKQMLCW